MTKEQQKRFFKTAVLAFCLACEEPMEEMEANHVPQDLSVSGTMLKPAIMEVAQYVPSLAL